MPRHEPCVIVMVFTILFTALTSTTTTSKEARRGQVIGFLCGYEDDESGDIKWSILNSTNAIISINFTVDAPIAGFSRMMLNTSTLPEGNYSIVCYLESGGNQDASSVTFFLTLLRKYKHVKMIRSHKNELCC